MIWFIISPIAFFILYWFFTVPCLIDREDYEPIGLKRWSLFLIIIVSILPILNIIAVIAAIIMFFIIKEDNYLDWDEVFPEDKTPKSNKFINFWNKDIGKKK